MHQEDRKVIQKSKESNVFYRGSWNASNVCFVFEALLIAAALLYMAGYMISHPRHSKIFLELSPLSCILSLPVFKGPWEEPQSAILDLQVACGCGTLRACEGRRMEGHVQGCLIHFYLYGILLFRIRMWA